MSNFIDLKANSNTFLEVLTVLSKNDEELKKLLPFLKDEVEYIADNFRVSTIGDIIDVLQDDVNSWEGNESIFAEEVLIALQNYIK